MRDRSSTDARRPRASPGRAGVRLRHRCSGCALDAPSPVGVHPVLEPVERVAQLVERAVRALRLRQRIALAGDPRERRLRAPNALVDLSIECGRQLVGAVQLAHHAADRRARERRGQRIGGPALALMRLVEDRDVVGRQEAAAHREIEKEQRVIDDDEIGVSRLIAPLEEQAIAKVLAELADAIVGIGVELFPFVGARHECQARRDRPSASVSAQCPDPLHRARRRDQPVLPQRARTSAGTDSDCVP